MYSRQWIRLINIKERGKDKDFLRLYSLYKIWRHFINYSSMHRINKYFMSKRVLWISSLKLYERTNYRKKILYHK